MNAVSSPTAMAATDGSGVCVTVTVAVAEEVMLPEEVMVTVAVADWDTESDDVPLTEALLDGMYVGEGDEGMVIGHTIDEPE